MKAIIQTSELKGMVQAPASKSSMQRAVAAALLRDGNTIIHHPGHSNDDKASMDIAKRLGAELELQGTDLFVRSKGIHPITDTVNCGESGLSIRMFTPLVALNEKEIIVTGEGSLLSRPMDFFDEILPKLGVKVNSVEGKLPLKIQGPLIPTNIEIDGSLSSQFLTGLLMAYSISIGNSNWSNQVSIKVNNLKSKPYINLTLDVMKQFGMPLPENRDFDEFIFHPGKLESNRERDIEYTVEGDWSGGAFLLAAGAIAGPILVRGLDLGSSQADKAIVEVLMKANAGLAVEAKGIRIHPSPMTAFDFDATDCPDLFPPLVALAAYCKGVSSIKGVHRLMHKESNRSIALQEEFGKMGLQIDIDDDLMSIIGNGSLNAAHVHSRHDHRIAMACAVAAIAAKGETIIEEAQAVRKSYPDFYEDLQSLGGAVTLNNKIHLHE